MDGVPTMLDRCYCAGDAPPEWMAWFLLVRGVVVLLCPGACLLVLHGAQHFFIVFVTCNGQLRQRGIYYSRLVQLSMYDAWPASRAVWMMLRVDCTARSLVHGVGFALSPGVMDPALEDQLVRVARRHQLFTWTHGMGRTLDCCSSCSSYFDLSWGSRWSLDLTVTDWISSLAMVDHGPDHLDCLLL